MENEKKTATKTSPAKKTTKKVAPKTAAKTDAKVKKVTKKAEPKKEIKETKKVEAKVPKKEVKETKKTVPKTPKVEVKMVEPKKAEVSKEEMAKKEAQKKKKKTTIQLFNLFIGKNILIDIIMFAFAIFFISKPFGTMVACEVAVSTLLVINGITALFDSSTEVLFPLFKLNIVYGLLAIVSGLIIFNPLSFDNILAIMFGSFLIISGLLKIFYASYLKYSKEDSWTITMVIGIMMILLGILLLFNPFEGSFYITELIGIFMALYAVLDITNNWLFRRRFEDLIKVFNK